MVSGCSVVNFTYFALQACQSVLSAAGGGEVNKESIVWAKFHSTDYNDPENFLADTECQSDSVPPLLVVLGYGSGVQVCCYFFFCCQIIYHFVQV